MGDSKFIPRCSKDAFDALAVTSFKAQQFYKATKGAIFASDNARIMHFGYPEDGHMTTYYLGSNDITKEEIQAVSEWMQEKKLLVVSSY
jgi:dipeptidyl-peptidase-3